MQLDDRFCERQPETGPLMLAVEHRIHPVKRLHHERDVLGADAYPGIPDANVQRRRVDLSDSEAFSGKTLRLGVDLTGARWVRLEAWDVAANGAFSQPVWLE